MSNWIKLTPDFERKSEYRSFEESMREGKKGRRARRSAEDTAYAQVVRLYLMLGQTSDGRIDFKKTGDRLIAEDCMRESGDELLCMFDRMAQHGVINRELWAGLSVISTTDAVKQAESRQRRKESSDKANAAKKGKVEATDK